MKAASLIGLVALAVGVPPLLNDYQVYLLSLSLVWGIFALSMGLLLGFIGEINLGQAAFVAIGAYVSTLLRLKAGFSFWAAAPVALAAVVAIAALVGLLTLRLRGPFFVLVMLGFGEIVRLVVANWQDMTNGMIGLRSIPPPEGFLGIDFGSKLGFYYLALVTLALCTAALARLVRAKTGRMLVAIREDVVLAEFVGIAIMRHKVIALCVSAFVAGVGGLLLGPLLSVLSPGQFTVFASVDMVVMVIVGGVGTLAGPLIGAAFLIYVPEAMSFARELRPVLMGGLLVIVTMFFPEGLLGLARSLIRPPRRAVPVAEEARSDAT